ncbi:MAG: 2-C-methyl-D-erythritol 4-phosphate cytidylyltransferase [Bacteroidota bacterium]|nr:2-C-methyl-D-erythritol 4-phosphate cytidylyltransferase [Bacteroidota bacterium]
MTQTIIIVAGGRGTRMKSDIPKQFLLLDGKPVLMQTMEAFVEFDPDIRMILVLPEDQYAYWDELCDEHSFSLNYQKVAGGLTRFESVKNGLSAAPDKGLIGVHDGVRPFIHPDTIRRIYQDAEEFGNAIPAIPPTESVRVETKDSNHIVDRNSVRLIQTPQVFQAKDLKEAYNQQYQNTFTDDASVIEAAGHKIHLIKGQEGNLKITTKEDLGLGDSVTR